MPAYVSGDDDDDDEELAGAVIALLAPRGVKLRALAEN